MPTLYAVQLDIVWENKPATFARVRLLLERAKPTAGSLIVLPEMFATGFSMNVEMIKEGTLRAGEAFLKEIAREFKATVIGGVVNTNSDSRGLNQALAIAPDGTELLRFDKMHPFSLARENVHFAAGNLVGTFEWAGLKVSPAVCYDLRFPEQFRQGAQQGAQVFTVIANWPVKREAHWLTLLAARAIENQAYVVGVNRCGKDPHFTYSGRTVIIDPHGVIIADAGNVEGICTAEIDRDVVEQWRVDFPALRDGGIR